MGKTRSVYQKKRKFYGNQFHRNKSLSEEAILEDESCMQSTVSSADVIDEVVHVIFCWMLLVRLSRLKRLNLTA